MAENLLQSSITGFTEALASKTSVPGGGGASALVGSIGIALGDMVGEFTLGKKKYAAVEPEIKELMAKAQDLRVRLLDCITKDAEAFEPLSKAYAIPKDDPDRDAIMEKCLVDAAQAPLEILRLSAEAIALQKEFGEKGSVIVISDAATGVVCCKAAMQGAAVNVKINTSSMKNREVAEAMNKEVEETLAKWMPVADEVFARIYSRY